MIKAKPYPKEAERIAAVRSTNLLDTPIEERFERITRLVCRIMDVPIALFNLIDEDRQHYKSAQGIPKGDADLETAFCTHALHEEKMLLVPNAHKDNRFSDNPFVTGEFLDIGFYAGCPVHTPTGMPIGTLCAIDTKPREMTTEQLAGLRDLAAILETELRIASLSKAQASLMEELNVAHKLALVDPLTHLWNRSGITNLLDKEWAEAERKGKSVTLVMADIDFFKTVNDTHGHQAGDDVLKGVSKKLLSALRTEDSVGRMGGEEFLIILTDCQPDKVFETVERIRMAIENQELQCGERKCRITMSFGASTAIPSKAMNTETLIKQADDALYEAKNSGRNRVEIAA